MPYEGYTIRVHIIEARSLRGTNESKGFAVSAITRLRLTAGEGPTLIDKTMYSSKQPDGNSAYWNEVRIFNERLSREMFHNGRLEVAVEDAGFFSNTLVGAAQFDLETVYDYPDHEIFGQWAALMDESKGSAVQGFIRISVTCLREGDVPRIHGPNDLDKGQEPDMGIVMNMPAIEPEGFLLAVRINKIEIAPFGVSKPKLMCRLRFGATEVKSRECRENYATLVNDELRIPIYMPTLTDKINLEMVDTSSFGGEKVICKCVLSARDVIRDQLVTQWRNM